VFEVEETALDEGLVEAVFCKHGFSDFRWMSGVDVVVGEWVRMKCLFGCGAYGKSGGCPPNVPSVEECRAFFAEYSAVAVFHVAKRVAKPEDRFVWSREVNRKLLGVEQEVFLAGYHKAFLLFMDECRFCDVCPGTWKECKNPKLARPSIESFAVDVFTTVRKLGYPIDVLRDYGSEMNRYAFLLVE
jgi:predicted metal-binding protein